MVISELDRQISPVEKELRFVQWMETNDVKNFFLDLDDTICSTRSVFIRQKRVCANYLAGQTKIDSDKWLSILNEANIASLKAFGVNPSYWDRSLSDIAQAHKLSKSVQDQATQIVKNIYYIPLDYLPGAEEGLKFLKKAEINFGIITHRNVDWTWRTFNWLKLDRFLSWEDIYIIDENGQKTADTWYSGMSYFRAEPYYSAIVGDNPLADIMPAMELGVRHRFLVVDGRPKQVIHTEVIGPDTQKIKSLADLQYLRV